jgi:hypothetical protein
MHSRICLEFDDQAELKQCQAQLAQLYEEGLGTADGRREFTAYDILYNVGQGALNNVSDLMLQLDLEDRINSFISHALRVRAAAALGNYVRLFAEYRDAPGHSQHVMDTFADVQRLQAVKVMLRGYAPTVPLSVIASALAFETEAEAAEFVVDHGCVLGGGEGGSGRHVECKESKAGWVDHSISKKLEEERKNAQRKAEIVPISFS